MSPRKQPRQEALAVTAAVDRLWIAYGQQVRDARVARGWSVAELARRAGLSPSFVYAIEAGQSGSAEGATRIAHALGRRAELSLVNPRAAVPRDDLSVDVVHSAMGEFETAHLRLVSVKVGLDEPYQHYQFSGRADLVAWDVERRALLHMENRTRFPDFQSMAGSFNGKRAYLAESLGERLGVGNWASQTHVLCALWSSEVLRALRLRTESFRALCPDPPGDFARWWKGDAPTSGITTTLVVLDPLATGRQRPFVGLDDALAARPRYRGYADAAAGVRQR